MLWSLFCFWGYSMASRDSGIKKCFLFRFGDRHYEKTVAISVINSVMQMNGFPPRAAKLRLWIDENHDGISQPEELHTLPELGVSSIGLKYVQTRNYDEFGNIFRYMGKLNPDGEPHGDQVNRKLYDVIL